MQKIAAMVKVLIDSSGDEFYQPEKYSSAFSLHAYHVPESHYFKTMVSHFLATDSSLDSDCLEHTELTDGDQGAALLCCKNSFYGHFDTFPQL